jgi:hypothetical protein
MKKLFIPFVLSIILLVYLLLPAGPMKTFSDDLDENWVIGHYAQTTGGDFTVLEHNVPELAENFLNEHSEINLTGEVPSKKIGIESYELRHAKFTLKGKVVGSETEEDGYEYAIFEVENSYLAEYIPRLYNHLIIFLVTCTIFTISTFLLIRKVVSQSRKRHLTQ